MKLLDFFVTLKDGDKVIVEVEKMMGYKRLWK